MRVLIVDDSQVARVMFADMLVDCGHQVVAEADDLEKALEAYRTHKPDLVTLDISMPKADGLTVLKALRQLDGQARVVVVSGNSQQRIYDAMMAAGALGFITKPVFSGELKESLAKLGIK